MNTISSDLVVFEASERRWPFPWEPRSSDIGVLRVIDWVEGTALILCYPATMD